jgi:hypothetical protein
MIEIDVGDRLVYQIDMPMFRRIGRNGRQA